MLGLLKRLLPKNRFARSVSMVVGGTAGAQVLGVLAAPLLTRLYAPEDFGLLAIYSAILAVIGVISSLRYQVAITLAEDEAEACNVAALSFILVVVTSAVTTLAAILITTEFKYIFKVPGIGDYLWLLPFGILIGGAQTVLNYWAIRRQHFNRIGRCRVYQTLATLVIQVLAFKFGGISLIFGLMAGGLIGIIGLIDPDFISCARREIKWTRIFQCMSRYRRFPIFSTWESLADTAGAQSPVILFGFFFNSSVAGLYALASRVLSIPFTLIGTSVSQVFMIDAVKANRDNQLARIVEKIIGILVAVGLPPTMALMVVAPDLFAVIFGEGWRQSGVFARWLVPWILVAFVSAPLATVIAVTERQKHGLIFQMILLGTRIIGISVGIKMGDMEVAILLFACSSVVVSLAFIFWISKILGLSARYFAYTVVRAISSGAVISLPLLIVVAMENHTAGSILIASICTAALILASNYGLMRRAYTKDVDRNVN